MQTRTLWLARHRRCAAPRATRRSGAPLDVRELFEMALLIVALLANDLLLPRVLYGDGLERYSRAR